MPLYLHVCMCVSVLLCAFFVWKHKAKLKVIFYMWSWNVIYPHHLLVQHSKGHDAWINKTKSDTKFYQSWCLFFLFISWWASQGQITWGGSCARGQVWMGMSSLAARLKRRLFKMSAAPSLHSSWLTPSKYSCKTWIWEKCFLRWAFLAVSITMNKCHNVSNETWKVFVWLDTNGLILSEAGEHLGTVFTFTDLLGTFVGIFISQIS